MKGRSNGRPCRPWPGKACLFAVLAVGLLGGVVIGGCSDDLTYAVVTVRATEGEFTDIAQFRVYVSNGSDRQDNGLYYPKTPAGPYPLTPTQTVDFSVGFSSIYQGMLKIGVEPRTSVGIPLGYGESAQVIDPGHVMHFDVAVVRSAQPPTADGDAAVAADLAPPPSQCVPTAPATCGANKTCIVDCYSGVGVGACVAAGTHPAGDSCTGNIDCQPGTQCFKYACGNTCIKFCESDADCGGGHCFSKVPCGTTETAFKICSQPCDPRGVATTGCATGLTCFLFPGQESACDCRDARRSKGDGVACTDAGECQPGLICVSGDAGMVCRPICKLADKDCPSGRTCAQLTNPTYETWGACIPTP